MDANQLPPIARTENPATSHEAAHALTQSGKRVSQMDVVYQEVFDCPGLTSGVIGELLQGTVPGYWKRLSDLKNAGKIYQGPPRKYQGRNQVTWFPIEQNSK